VHNKLIEQDRNPKPEIVGAIDFPFGPDHPNPIEPDKLVPNKLIETNPIL
jgi:hypothetical protein